MRLRNQGNSVRTRAGASSSGNGVLSELKKTASSSQPSRTKTRATRAANGETPATSAPVEETDENAPANRSVSGLERSVGDEKKPADLVVGNVQKPGPNTRLRSRSRDPTRNVPPNEVPKAKARPARKPAAKGTFQTGSRDTQDVAVSASCPVRAANTVTVATSTDDEEEEAPPVATSSVGNNDSKAKKSNSSELARKPNAKTISPTGNDGEPVEEEAVERMGAVRSRTSQARPVKAANKFYGQTASPSAAEDIQQRLNELSFAQEASSLHTVEDRRRVVKKRVGTRAAKSSPKKASKKKPRAYKRRAKPARLGGPIHGIVKLGRDPPPGTLEKNKFFKHHLPTTVFRFRIYGGKIKYFPCAQPATKKGVIDFDHKDGDLSHVAADGGKCDIFGLKSAEDLERSGVPKASLSGTSGVNLRKRKPASRAQPKKKTGLSPWRYAEDERLVEKPSFSRTLDASTSSCIQTIDERNVTTRRALRSRRAEKLASIQQESTPAPSRAGVVKSRLPPGLSPIVLLEALPTEAVQHHRKKTTKHVPTSKTGDQSEKSPIAARMTAECEIDDICDPGPSNDIPSREPSPAQMQSSRDYSPEIHTSPLPSPCPSPAPSPDPEPSCSHHSGRSPASAIPLAVPGPSHSRRSVSTAPVSSAPSAQSGAPYNPLQDAFGFGRMQFRARRKAQNPFVEVASPTKKPKELTPKIMAPTSNQLSIKEALGRSAKERVTSTPTKRGAAAVAVPAASLEEAPSGRPILTSTPWDPNGNRTSRFNGASSSSTPSAVEAPASVSGTLPLTSTPWESNAKRVHRFYGTASSSTPKTDGFTGSRKLFDRLGSKQLQIDAGQKKYGASECPTCGMIFSQGEAEDEREHQKFHKQMDSVLQVKLLNNCTVVDVVPKVGRAIMVTARDTKHIRDKVAGAVKFANRLVGLDEDAVELDFDKHPQRTFAAFVHDTGRIVSILAAEPCSWAQQTLPGQRLVIDTENLHPVQQSIVFMWTLPEFRKKGLAALLLFKMRAFLAGPANEPLSFDEIAFADLTPDLYRFVTALSQRDTVFVTA